MSDLVLVLGDTHGNLKFIREAVNRLAVPHGVDIIHVVGDFGYWTHTNGGMKFLRGLNQLARTHDLLFTFNDGNHENFDDLEEQPVDEDGWRRISGRIWHAPRGHTWEWGNTRFLALGGANSIDGPDGPAWWKARMGQGRGPVEAGTPIWNGKQFVRLSKDIDLENWWPQENVTRADVDRAIEAAQGLDIDVMLTHDCPEGVEIPGIHGYPMGDENRMLIRKAMDEIQPTHLIHGHYHKWVRDQLNDTEIVGLAHDGGKNGQYIFIETDETNVIIPEW